MFEMAKILVIGTGGVGSRTVSQINNEHFEGIELIGVNADWQLLDQKAEKENTEKLTAMMKDASMAIVICDMGDGTETEAAPIAAKLARGQGGFTVGIAAKPFQIEEKERMAGTLSRIDRFKGSVDALIVIPNDNQLEDVDEDNKFSGKMEKSDEMLLLAIRGITDLFKPNRVVDLDFADVVDFMKNKGLVSVGIGSAKGPERALEAVKIAITNPLTETAIVGASHIIINVLGDITLLDVADVETSVCNVIGKNASIAIGAGYDEAMMDEVRVTVIATGFWRGP